MSLLGTGRDGIDERIEVIISDDNMVGYIKLEKPVKISETGGKVKSECNEAVEGDDGEPLQPPTAEDIFNALEKSGVIFGVKEDNVRKLAERPICGIKIEVARGNPPEDGENGFVEYYVKRDSEYKPEIDEEGKIDYKNLKYFQQVNQGHLLAKVTKETDGVEGTNIFGAPVPAKSGKRPASPKGKNTEFNEDETELYASASGVVRFARDLIDINEVMNIRADVGQATGNIDFPGDVIIDGDVSFGFSVKAGGNINVKGMVEGAYMETPGNVTINKGINGAGGEKIIAGGDLRSGYIENANLQVDGNIMSDYIIDSEILCKGNIILAGRNELIIGGNTRLYGELTAKNIGNENERITRIEIMGVVIADTESIERITAEREEYNANAIKLMETLNQYRRFDIPGVSEDEIEERLKLIKQQLGLFKDKIDGLSSELKRLDDESYVEYRGTILCKRKIYQGVKIFFGDQYFRFELDDVERCRIFWHEGEIIQGTL